MEPEPPFDGHLRRIAEAARRWTPRLVSITPFLEGGRMLVYVKTDVCSSAVFLSLIRRMETFCRREAIPPDYRFSYNHPLPGMRPHLDPSAADVPSGWPPNEA